MSDSASASALRSRRETLATLERALAARSARLSGLRGVLFLVAIAALIYAATRDVPAYAWVLVALAWFVFFAIVAVHGGLVTRETEVKSRIGIVDRWLERTQDKLPEPLPSSPAADPTHPYAVDLDVFGPSSVFQLLDDTRTVPGTWTLAAWLAMRASPQEIAARQEAVRELSTRVAFREDLAALGVSGSSRGRSVEPLVSWAELPPVLGTGLDRALVRAAFVLVPLTIVLFTVATIMGDAAPALLRRAWYVPFGLQLVVLFLVGGKVAPMLAKAASKESPFGRYKGMFARIEAEPFEAPRLQSLRESLGVGKDTRPASQELASFERILGFVELRNSGLVYLAANIILLWDVFCGYALEHFRARAGKNVRGWFKSLGEIEALSSMGAFAYEHPTYSYPVVEEGPPCFSAENLGHPLIPSDRRVGNSVELPGPGHSLLVTGSNMSGKSTWLRSMGLAAVLAQAGAPVCAKKLRMTPLSVRTSMRISDSLEHGVSHFYAELEKLKSVVDAADRGEPVFFLLDEVLHGTNSRERHIGARAVVVHLLQKSAIGAVTSHDLALADMAETTNGRVVNVHFKELVHENKMTFDYVLSPGVVSTTNALRLMKIVGIAVKGIEDE
ncbi:MAG: DNA mismatch repair protein MutS [Polyangiaceae bacterium]|nr:DNA mismatch repair protein MutS [Polyangiaceae bacterium]